MTYPNARVQQKRETDFVPVRYNLAENPDAMQQFSASWTPTIIIQDADGREARRSEGYLDPQRFIAELSLAQVKAALNAQNDELASMIARKAVTASKGDAQREPEALYWQAVTGYRLSGSGGELVS